jgi:hypothetical protein
MGRTTVDTHRAAHESLAGETIVIDTISGRLLMITGFGSALWDGLVEGVDLERLFEEVGRHYGADATDAVVAFVDTLRSHEFLVDGAEPLEDQAGSGPGLLGTWPDEFVRPTIETYDEIAEIMTMDPIHEVDPDLGWPHVLSEPAPHSPTTD